jgi:hypothetical protein
MKINLKACSLALCVALMSTMVHGATKEELAVCEAKYETAFAVMNGRQNLVKKEDFLKLPETTQWAAQMIERAYREEEVPVHDIAYAVRDFADSEKNRCLTELAI